MAFFSIVVPTANRARWVEFCLRSLKEQTFKDFNVIVSDNGDDDTKQVFDKYADERFRYVRCEEKGLTANWRFALPLAQGTYVGYIQNKMFFYKDSLQTLYTYINESGNPDTIAYYPDFYRLNVDDTDGVPDDLSGILNYQDGDTGWRYVDSTVTLLDRLSWNSYIMSTKATVGNGCIMAGFLKNSLIKIVESKYGEFFDCIFPDFGGAILPLYESKKNIEIIEHLVVYIGLKETSGTKMTEFPSRLKEFVKLSGKEHIMQYAVVPDYVVSNTNVATADYNYLMTKISAFSKLRCNKLNALISIELEKRRLKEKVPEEEEKMFQDKVEELSETDRCFFEFMKFYPPRDELNLAHMKTLSSPFDAFSQETLSCKTKNSNQELNDFCGSHKVVYCYGAGDYGNLVKRYLDIKGVRIKGFLVTDEPLVKTVDGIPVYQAEKITPIPGEEGVILSLRYFWHNEVIDLLKKKGWIDNDICSKVDYGMINNILGRLERKRCK